MVPPQPNARIDGTLVACHECDTLSRIPELATGRSAYCRCCNSVLFRNPRGGVDWQIALNVTALILLVLANSFPFLVLQLQGREEITTIFGTARALYVAGMGELAVVVFITTILGPALLNGISLYVLLGARLGRYPPGSRSALSWYSHIKPWGMIDVFMLGVLVSFVKLAALADMVLGPALYAFVALIVVSAAAMAVFEPLAIWPKVDRQRRNRRAR